MISVRKPRHFFRDACGPCEICPNKPLQTKIIRADGPPDATVLFIGEKPGADEDEFGRPFIGDTGEDFNGPCLGLAGLRRDHVLVANAVRCYAVNGGDNPSKEQAAICAGHFMPWLIERFPQLELIVTMGGVAYSLLGQERDLDRQNGIPLVVEDFYGTGPIQVVPTIHPSAGLHKPQEYRRVRNGFRAVKRVLAGEWLIGEDAYPAPTYGIWNGDIEALLQSETMALDTESDSGLAWCLTFTTAPGEGWMVRADDPELVVAFNEALQLAVESGSLERIVLHYALHDVPVTREMGVELPWELIDDTMMAAYHRGEPQALKTLAFRLCGMDMQDYEDVVRPYAEAKMFKWLRTAMARLLRRDAYLGWVMGLAQESTKQNAGVLPPREYKGAKVQRQHGEVWADKMWKLGVDHTHLEAVAEWQSFLIHEAWLWASSPWASHEKGTIVPWKRINRILKDAADGKEVRPFERWRKIEGKDEWLEGLVRQLAGDPPSAGISEVPFEEAIVYACRDADATWRVDEALREITRPEVV